MGDAFPNYCLFSDEKITRSGYPVQSKELCRRGACLVIFKGVKLDQ